MNKKELATVLASKLGMSQAKAEETVEAVVDTLTDTLKSGEKVNIHGFGIFEAKTRAARKARNPKTGESIEVPESRVPKFKPGKNLKDAVAI